jgi:hypothetical protein
VIPALLVETVPEAVWLLPSPQSIIQLYVLIVLSTSPDTGIAKSTEVPAVSPVESSRVSIVKAKHSELPAQAGISVAGSMVKLDGSSGSADRAEPSRMGWFSWEEK